MASATYALMVFRKLRNTLSCPAQLPNKHRFNSAFSGKKQVLPTRLKPGMKSLQVSNCLKEHLYTKRMIPSRRKTLILRWRLRNYGIFLGFTSYGAFGAPNAPTILGIMSFIWGCSIPSLATYCSGWMGAYKAMMSFMKPLLSEKAQAKITNFSKVWTHREIFCKNEGGLKWQMAADPLFLSRDLANSLRRCPTLPPDEDSQPPPSQSTTRSVSLTS